MAIRVLDPSVVGRIAAGEVVERPSSVAKELIENSIDAGATAITVEIRGGGIEYLRVTDNGCGIEPGQVAIAFENHATSKLQKADELDDIRTLGFRGEALPSIAAVSHIEMTTRRKNSPSGVKLLIDGGVKHPVTEAGCPEGTTVIVKELFYNVPVRRTFLKRPNYEGALVNDLVAKMILGNPGVSFRFINNSKTVYHSFGDGNLKHAIFAVYGSETAEKMIDIDASCGGMRIKGAIGVGELSKATRAHQSLFINGRTVRCALLTQVLEQVCKGRVTIGTYPMCALTLTIPPASVDVNVHPNKLEVRFRDEQSIRLASETILSQAFVKESMLDLEQKQTPVIERRVEVTHKAVAPADVSNKTEVAKETTVVENAVSANIPKSDGVKPAYEWISQNRTVSPREIREDLNTKLPSPAEIVKKIHENEGSAKEETRKTDESRAENAVPKPTKIAPQRAETISLPTRVCSDEPKPEQLSIESVPSAVTKPRYRIIGTLFNTYILIELEDSMLMVDQHAAHERIMYEKFTKRLYSGESAAQTLLVPIIIDVSSKEMALIMDSRDELYKAGYDVEQFGDRSVSLRSVPFIMGSAQAKPAFMQIIGSLDRINSASKESRADEIAVMACKAAVKAGDRLAESEIEALLTTMLETGASPTCPHGRPVSRTLTKRDIEKLFKRIQ